MLSTAHRRITDIIIGHLLADDPGTWSCPWHRAQGRMPINALTGHSYRGINTLTLWSAARREDYPDHRWATLKQWNELGARVLKGEKGSPCIFYSRVEQRPQPASDDGTRPERKASNFYDLMKTSQLFNAAQVEGAPALPQPLSQSPSSTPATPPDPTPLFDQFVVQTGAVIRPGNMASYDLNKDVIRMPAREAFVSSAGYTATLAHELIHWTGAPHRLNRSIANRRGTKSYALEELVAELGSAFVLAGLGLATEPHPQHAAYLASWLPLVQSDPTALFTAAARASRAADWLAVHLSTQ